MVRIRQALGTVILDRIKGIDVVFFRGDESERLKVLEQAAELWESGKLPDIDMVGMVRLSGQRTWRSEKLLTAISAKNVRPYLPLVPQFLSHPDVAVRESAIELIGRLEGSAYLSEVLPFLRDSEATVRRRAVVTVGKLGGPQRGAVVIPLLEDKDPGVRESAVSALAQLRANGTREPVTRLLKDGDERVRRAALRTLISLEAVDQAEAALPLLADSDYVVRMLAVELLAKSGAQHRKDIGRLLADPEDAVRIQALEALEKLRGRECAQEVCALLQAMDGRVRAKAAHCLGLIGSSEQAQPLSLLLNDPDLEVRRSVIDALAGLGAKEVAEKVVPFCKSEDPESRRLAVVALGKMLAFEQASRIAPLVKDPSEKVRVAAVEALGRMGSQEELGVVVRRLYSEKPMAEAAFRVVLALGTKEHGGAILEATRMASNAGRMRGDVGYLMRVIGAEPDPRGLVPWLGSSDNYMRQWAFEELDAKQEQDALTSITERLGSKDAVTQAWACLVAGPWAGSSQPASRSKVVDRLKALLASSDGNVKVSSASSLTLLGQMLPPEQLAVVREIIKQDVAPDPPFLAGFLNALSYATEPAASTLVDGRIRLGVAIDSTDQLGQVVKAHGLELIAGPDDLHPKGRLPAGLDRSIRWLLSSSLEDPLRYHLVLEKSTIHVKDTSGALKAWETRLSQR